MPKRKIQRKRNIDKLAFKINLSLGRSLVFIQKKEIRLWKAVFILALVVGFFLSIIWMKVLNITTVGQADFDPVKKAQMIETIKDKGCVFDGLLNNFSGDTDNLIDLLERSECQYVHRAVETWLSPPDFNLIKKNLDRIKKPSLIYSMFIAEALNPNAVYYDEERGMNFNFAEMCQPGSVGFWGPTTCQANLHSKEYQKYISYITRRAIDLGIDTFLFGQVNFQDRRRLFSYAADDVVAEMRKYASQQNRTIIIGAQTGTISDEKYLRIFDYIEGGVGLYPNGETIDNQPCYSAWPGRCWPMLWHKKYSQKASNVVIHLDWSGLPYDDMSKFARMDHQTRIKALYNLYTFFRTRNMGFLMPFSAVIYEDNGGCYGHARNFYSADNKYSCQDENEINLILAKRFRYDDARFLEQSVPQTMVAGQNYPVSISFLNSGFSTWSYRERYYLAVQNPSRNNVWGEYVLFDQSDEIKKGEVKTFSFEVQAPQNPGIYNFQWRLVNNRGEYFGDYSSNVKVFVTPSEF